MAWVKSVEGGAVLWPRDRKRGGEQRTTLLLLLLLMSNKHKRPELTNVEVRRAPRRARARAWSCLAAAAIRHCQEPANPPGDKHCYLPTTPGPYTFEKPPRRIYPRPKR
jgi:hypothetical protein